MNQSSNHFSSDGETPQSVDRSLLEFLKPKSEERYSKLEAYCDLLSRASAGTYATPEADGALQLLPGQFVATISELSRQWKWQRATVRQFITGLANLGHISTQPYSKSFIFSVNLSQRLSLFVETPDDILDFCAMQFVRYLKGRTKANDVAESYNRYYTLKMSMAQKEGNGGIPARHVLHEQAVIFDGLAISMLHVLDAHRQMPEELSDSVSLLFGKDHVWDWHKVIAVLGIMAAALRKNSKPSYMANATLEYSKGEVILMDCIFEHYSAGVGSTYYDNPPRRSTREDVSQRREPLSPTPSVSSSAENNIE